MDIRQANKNDITQMVPLLDEVSKLHFEKRPDMFKIKTHEEIKSNLEEMIQDESNIILLAEDKQIVVGVIICEIKEKINRTDLKDSKVLWINEICVKQEYRRNGIGRSLIEKAKEIAKANNCLRLELNCWELNGEAMKFYENQGLTTQRRVMEINI